MTDDLDLVRRLRDDTDCDPAALDRERSRWTANLADSMRPHAAPVVKPEHRALLDQLDEQGYAVIEDAIAPDELAAVREALAPHLSAGPYGRNDFEGFMTQRVYSLPVKSRAFDRLIEDEAVLAVAENCLGPNFLLTAALAINLGPGETAQGLHYDEAFYSLPRPRPPLSLSAIWAIDDFTADNGGTLLVPGSHRWGDEGLKEERDVVPLAMPAGSVAVYPGTLWHAGGANATDRFRLGISIQYVVSWARQQESYLLAMPPEAASGVSPRLRELLGYSIGPAFMGHVDGRHPEKLVHRR
ncbi:MAG TPA: phytanoyl-CoA dioxygenase family protein [Acidimicrobiia bacterium]|nr:phytanoyl-CoA dioxygenase family protein [Acidimicrobiia bacterium]